MTDRPGRTDRVDHEFLERGVHRNSTRVPLIFAGPGVIPGQTCDRSVELPGIYPTLVDLADLPEVDHL